MILECDTFHCIFKYLKMFRICKLNCSVSVNLSQFNATKGIKIIRYSIKTLTTLDILILGQFSICNYYIIKLPLWAPITNLLKSVFGKSLISPITNNLLQLFHLNYSY